VRERLVIAFVGLTVAVIGLYGVPRAYFLADLVQDDAHTALTGTAAGLRTGAEERIEHDEPVDKELLRSALEVADRVEYVSQDGQQIAVGRPADPDGGVTVERTLIDGGTLRLSVSGDTVGKSVRDAILPLVLLGLALAAGAAALGIFAARRLSRPFQELAAVSREVGRGRFDTAVPSYAVPEADAIATSLRGAASDLEGLVRREREFAANASHQLRTPITALRLSLEDLTLWPETDPAVRAELANGLGELDRLSRAIDDLLDLARGRRLDAQHEVDLAELAGAAAARWQRAVDDAGRVLTVAADAPAPARVPVGPVEQVIDVLIDNAVLHGDGEIVVAVVDADTHWEVAVTDGGERPDGDVFGRGVSSRIGRVTAGPDDGHGIGLAVATELAEVCGGHLSLDASSPGTRFVLWLPKWAGSSPEV